MQYPRKDRNPLKSNHRLEALLFFGRGKILGLLFPSSFASSYRLWPIISCLLCSNQGGKRRRKSPLFKMNSGNSKKLVKTSSSSFSKKKKKECGANCTLRKEINQTPYSHHRLLRCGVCRSHPSSPLSPLHHFCFHGVLFSPALPAPPTPSLSPCHAKTEFTSPQGRRRWGEPNPLPVTWVIVEKKEGGVGPLPPSLPFSLPFFLPSTLYELMKVGKREKKRRSEKRIPLGDPRLRLGNSNNVRKNFCSLSPFRLLFLFSLLPKTATTFLPPFNKK